MKISIKQLEMVISKMKYSMLGYKDEADAEIEISLTKEDPGTGVMLDCMTISMSKQTSPEEHGETKMSVEIYPASEKLEPVASKTEVFKIKGKY